MRKDSFCLRWFIRPVPNNIPPLLPRLAPRRFAPGIRAQGRPSSLGPPTVGCGFAERTAGATKGIFTGGRASRRARHGASPTKKTPFIASAAFPLRLARKRGKIIRKLMRGQVSSFQILSLVCHLLRKRGGENGFAGLRIAQVIPIRRAFRVKRRSYSLDSGIPDRPRRQARSQIAVIR